MSKITPKRIKLLWAKKIFKARFFVALTESDSVILLQAADPTRLGDAIAIRTQKATLTAWSKQLEDLIKQHDIAFKKLNDKAKSTKKEK